MAVAIGIVLLSLVLGACQYNGVIELDGDTRWVTITIEDTTQDRGRQSTEAVNPDITAGDVGLPAGL